MYTEVTLTKFIKILTKNKCIVKTTNTEINLNKFICSSALVMFLECTQICCRKCSTWVKPIIIFSTEVIIDICLSNRPHCGMEHCALRHDSGK